MNLRLPESGLAVGVSGVAVVSAVAMTNTLN
jgi:hypothetical protein